MGDTAMKGRVQLRDVEAGDLPLFFAHQRDPIAVALVAFRSRDRAAFDQHWEKLLADHSCLKKTIVVVSAVSADSSAHQVAGNNRARFTPVWRHTTRPRSASCKNAGSP